MDPLIQKILLSVLILGIVGGILGFFIGIFYKFFYESNNNKIDEIAHLLPGSNCGGCGYSNCNAFADAISKGDVNTNQCHTIKQEKVDQIKLILDEFDKIRVEIVENDKKDA